jgi:TrpR-related protein YerC/YecD
MTANKEAADYFYKAVLSLKNPDECRDFFCSLCTPLEINTMCQRLQVARLLSKGTVYLDIKAATTASTATISRVKRSMDGGVYDLLFDRLGENERKN